jgi:hypothetical protein
MTEEQLEPDPEIAALLREHYGSTEVEAPEWEALHRRVLARARPELAALRNEVAARPAALHVAGDAAAAPRRSKAVRRGMFVLPALLAACVALLLVTGPRGSDRPDDGMPAPLTVLHVDNIMDAEISDVELRAVLLGVPDAVALLLLAAADPDEG